MDATAMTFASLEAAVARAASRYKDGGHYETSCACYKVQAFIRDANSGGPPGPLGLAVP